MRCICLVIWQPIEQIIAELVPDSVNALDRYQIMNGINKAIDKVGHGETNELQGAGKEPVLKKSRWCLFKRPESLTEQ